MFIIMLLRGSQSPRGVVVRGNLGGECLVGVFGCYVDI